MRQIVLDTETTGLEPSKGHRIIEIGCVELINRRLTGNNFHRYLNPEREIDEGAVKVHGITSEFLADKPLFTDVADEFHAYLENAEVIIHNAPFDVGFIDYEYELLAEGRPKMDQYCQIVDTLAMARKKHPGQRNSLDALCKRYEIDNSQRQLHGALLDAEILADVYLAMTGGQGTLFATDHEAESSQTVERVLNPDRPKLKVLMATEAELAEHQQRLEAINQESGGHCLWLKSGEPEKPF